jgi:hypothetical protein
LCPGSSRRFKTDIQDFVNVNTIDINARISALREKSLPLPPYGYINGVDVNKILGLSPNNSVNSNGAIDSENDNGWTLSTRNRRNAGINASSSGTSGNSSHSPVGYPYDPNFPDYGINNPNAGAFPQYPADPNFPDYTGHTNLPGGSNYTEYDPNFPDYYPWKNSSGQQVEYDPNFPDYSRPKNQSSGLFSFTKKAKSVEVGPVVVEPVLK